MSRLFAAAGVCAALFLTAAFPAQAAPGNPTTPIQHLVVIFGENVSFDHYFATYPSATNPAGEPAFTPLAGTPTPDNLVSAPGNLLTANPNLKQPARLDRSVAVPCDQDHGYTDEQKAFDNGAMDMFVQFGSGGGCPGVNSIVMNYYDGNTVTALWNLANNFAMSDAFHGTTFGPSTPGAINLISGNTHGATTSGLPSADSANTVQSGSLIGDPNPENEDCGSGPITMSGQNIGDLMNAAGMSWGWFEGGFKLTAPGVCGSTHNNAAGTPAT